MKYMVLTALLALTGSAVQAAPLIVAHRGASVYAPENTTASAHLAWELGADGVEFDIYLTADNKVMCMHDKTTGRTGLGTNLNMKKATSEELARVDVGTSKDKAFEGIMIPSLKQMLSYHPEGKLMVIEIKDDPPTVAPTKAAIEATGRPWSEFNIISFNFDTCVEARKLMPEVEVYFLEGAKDKKTKKYKNFTSAILKKAKDANLTGVDLDYHGVTKELVDECHAMGMKFYAWTVDDEEGVKRMTRYGVESITTNRPDRTRHYVEKVAK